MSHPLGPRYRPAERAQGEKFIVYPPRQTYLLHTRLCQEIIDALISPSNNTATVEGEDGAGQMQGNISSALRRSRDQRQREAGEGLGSSPLSSGPKPLGLAYLHALGQSQQVSSSLLPPSRLSSSGIKRSSAGHRGSSAATRQSMGGVSSPLPPRLPPVDSFAFHGAALGTLNATIPYDASASGAIAAIFEQIGYYTRPVEDFVLIQTFADYTPDYSTVPMYGEGQPVRLAMKFPYYALVTINPFVRERDRLVDSLEPVARAKIENDRSAFRSFAHGYAQILHNMAKAYNSLYQNEMRTRALKKAQERQHFFTVSLFQLLGGESKERYGLRYEERCTWERLMAEWSAVRDHQLFADDLFAQFTREREAMLKAHRRGAFEIRLFRTLQERMSALRATLEISLTDFCASSRNLYTESRLLGNFLASKEVGLHQMDFQVLRRAAARDRNPSLYPANTTTLVNPLTVNTDVFTCTRYKSGEEFPELAVQREIRKMQYEPSSGENGRAKAEASTEGTGDEQQVTPQKISSVRRDIEAYLDPTLRKRDGGERGMYAAAAVAAAGTVRTDARGDGGRDTLGVTTQRESHTTKGSHLLLPSQYARLKRSA